MKPLKDPYLFQKSFELTNPNIEDTCNEQALNQLFGSLTPNIPFKNNPLLTRSIIPSIPNPIIQVVQISATLQQIMLEDPTEWKRRSKITQNFASKITTLVGLVLSKEKTIGGRSKDPFIKKQFTAYLKKHKASADQMILAFLYLFLRQKNIQPPLYLELKDRILEYLQCKQEETENMDQSEANEVLAKIKGWTALLAYLYTQQGGISIQFDKLREVSLPLFTGRQKATIEKRIKKLRKIEKQIGFHHRKELTFQNSCQYQ